MIARFRLLLPFAICVPQGEALSPYDFDLGVYRVRVHPPRLAGINSADCGVLCPTPVDDLLQQLKKDVPQDATEMVRMENAPTIQANLLAVDFHKPEFDRRKSTLAPPVDPSGGDPPLSLAFEVANSLLERIRSVNQASFVRPLVAQETLWRMDYLNDDETEIPQEPTLFRSKWAKSFNYRLCGLNSAIWTRIQSLPAGFQPTAWDTLLLDAEALLPHVSASIVLAFAALENLIESSLNCLAGGSTIPAELWEWINKRHGDGRLTPSVREQFDELLRILTGRSLKDDGKLWESFQHLRSARNSILHEGVAKIADTEVTPARASELVGQAKAIANWVEPLLPRDLQRPVHRGVFNWRFDVPLTAGTHAAQRAEPSDPPDTNKPR